MQFICDAPGRKTWFRIESEGEAARESDTMGHAVEKHFGLAHEAAVRSYAPAPGAFIERDIGLSAHVQRVMPVFLTLRDQEGTALATAMLPPGGRPDPTFRIIVVGPGNRDPYLDHGDAIRALGAHYRMSLDPERCYPYRGSRSVGE